MGIFSSLKKSNFIKKITNQYISNPSSKEIISNKIYDFISSNPPLDQFIRTDPILSNISPKKIELIIKEFEKADLGAPIIKGGHCPAISVFFFPDTIYFIMIAIKKGKKKYLPQLMSDVDNFFEYSKAAFIPSVDPR